MIKKLLLIAIFVFSLSGCSSRYNGWKKIELQDYGSIKVPEKWECHIQENEIYFVDEGTTEFSEENVHLGGYIYDMHSSDSTYVPSNVFPEIEKAEGVKGEVYSNSAYRGIKNYYIHGEWHEKRHITIYVSKYDKEIYMIAWDDTVSYDDLEKIAVSFTEDNSEKN